MGGFFHMGGYAAFVWPSFAVTSLVMVGLLAITIRAFRRAEADLTRLEGDADKKKPQQPGQGQ